MLLRRIKKCNSGYMFFDTSLIAGCSCADDPTPVEPQPEYCEVELQIEKATGLTAIVFVGEG